MSLGQLASVLSRMQPAQRELPRVCMYVRGGDNPGWVGIIWALAGQQANPLVA